MKKTLLKSMALVMMLCVSAMSYAVDWSGYDFLGDDAGGTYSNLYKCSWEKERVVNIQKPGWAAEAGIYCTFPAGISSVSVNAAIDGAGVCLYLSSFTAQETEVTVEYAGGTANFVVYYANGTVGGGNGETPKKDKYVITFTGAVDAPWFQTNDTIFADDEFTVTPMACSDKVKIDGSGTTKFAVSAEDETDSYTHRFNTQGSAVYVVVHAPVAGKLYVAGRNSSSSDEKKTIVITQGDKELYNAVVKDADKFANGAFPYIIVDVEAGDITLKSTSGGVLYYGFILETAGEEPEPSEPTLTAPDKAAPTPEWPAGQVKAIYSPTYEADCNFGEWGSGTQYSQDTYGKKYVTVNGGYFGMEFNGLNCVNMEKLHFDIWIATDATIRVVPIWGGGEYGVTVSLKGQQWNSIDIDKTEGDFAKVTDWSNVFQIKIDNAANLTFWIGNAYFYRAEAMEDNEAPTAVSAVVDATSYYSINIKANATDNSGTVNFTVYNGQDVVATKAGASAQDIIITVANLTPNTDYTFSVVASDDNNNKAEAVEVKAKTLVAPAAAPVPTIDAANVKSLYSDTYTSAIAVNNYCEYWWGSPAMLAVVLGDGNNTLYYTVAETAGSFGWAFADFDAKGYQKLHLSIYPVQEGTIGIRPVFDSESAELRTTETLKAGEWNEVVLDYTDLSFDKTFTQLGFLNFGSLGSFFIDNVYFWNGIDTPTGLNTPATADVVRKYIENGQLIIVRDGVRYNALGQIVE